MTVTDWMLIICIDLYQPKIQDWILVRKIKDASI